MEENLLTYLARRWDAAKPGTSRSKDQSTLQVPLCLGTVLLIATGNAGRETLDKITNLVRLVASKGGSAGSIRLSRSSDRRGGHTLSKLMFELIRGIKEHDQLHLIIDRYVDLFVTAPLTVVLSRFLGKPVMVEVVGPRIGSINRLSLYLCRPWLSLVYMLLVPVGKRKAWSEMIGSRIEETTPIIDLDSRVRGEIRNIQPSILADGRRCDISRLSELIEGYRLVKHKYPRIEMRILIDQKNREIHSAQPGLTFVTHEEKLSMGDLLQGIDILLSCQAELTISPLLLEGAAGGKLIFSGRRSALTRYLIDNCNFEPILFSDRSELADQIIRLIEKPENILFNSRLSRGLAERFAWDNLSDQWALRYARQPQ